MSVRFTCTACHTVLKVASVVTEERKVRCTGCGIVILLTPDDDSPTGMTISVPEKGIRTGLSPRAQRIRRNILIGVLVAILGFLGYGLWYSTRGPSDRGAVDGHVNLDDGPLEKGLITFIPIDGTKGQAVSAPIVRGRYSFSAAEGPAVGINRVEIRGENEVTVAKRFNLESKEKIEIKAGSITKDYDVKSK